MLELLGFLIPLALADSISPVRIGALVSLLGDRRPVAAATAFLAGLYISYYILGVLVAFGLDRALEFLFPAKPTAVDFAFGALVGFLMLFFGLRNVRSPRMERSPREVARSRSPFLMAVLINALTGLAALPLLAAIDRIIRTDISDFQMYLALAAYCLMFLAPYVGIVVVRTALGARGEALVVRLAATVDSSMSFLMAWLFVVLGVVALVDAGGYFLFDRPLW